VTREVDLFASSLIRAETVPVLSIASPSSGWVFGGIREQP
jgi:hypothetical protein